MHNALTRPVWTPGAVMEECEWDDFDQKLYEAVNGDLGGLWTPSKALEIGGAGVLAGGAGAQLNGPVRPGGLTGTGRRLGNPITAPNADTTLTIPANKVYRITTSVSADRVYTFSNTGALEGDVTEFYCDANFAFKITVRDATPTILALLGNGDSHDAQDAAFIFQNGAWRLLGGNKASGLQFAVYSTPGLFTFTVPRDVSMLWLEMWGAGGAGAGSNGGTTSATLLSRGGGGGGGAPRLHVSRIVTPGKAYDLRVPGASIGGPNNGVNGDPAVFDDAVNGAPTIARGGGGGKVYPFSSLGVGRVGRGGGPSDDGIELVSIDAPAAGLFQGGNGGIGTGVAGYEARNGGYADTANGFGGSPGTNGAVVGGFYGGGGGGGGGGGPGGPGGIGGNGGAGNNAGAGVAGGAGTTTTFSGAGGGGAGAGGNGTGGGGAGNSGGNGGPGMIKIVWVK